MRIAAMAAGAVGGYFGARMAAAGHDVFFIARGAHRDAIQKNGLTIESVHGDLHLPKPNVTDDPAKVGPVDIVLFAVKLWDTETAAAAARPLLGPDSRLITFQNGVDSVERLSGVLGPERVVGGAAYYRHHHLVPGRDQAHQPIRSDTFWPRRQETRQHAQCVRRSRQSRQARHRAVRRYRARPLAEIHFSHRHGRLDCGLRSPIGPIAADPELRGFFRALMEEAFAVGKAKGVPLGSRLSRRPHEFHAPARSSPA